MDGRFESLQESSEKKLVSIGLASFYDHHRLTMILLKIGIIGTTLMLLYHFFYGFLNDFLWYLYFLIFWVVLLKIQAHIYRKKVYVTCFKCNKSILVKTNWQCDKCNNLQGTAKLICEPCNRCGRRLKTAFCEHCHGEFKL